MSSISNSYECDDFDSFPTYFPAHSSSDSSSALPSACSSVHAPSFLRDDHEPIRSLCPSSFLAPQSFLCASDISNQPFRSVDFQHSTDFSTHSSFLLTTEKQPDAPARVFTKNTARPDAECPGIEGNSTVEAEEICTVSRIDGKELDALAKLTYSHLNLKNDTLSPPDLTPKSSLGVEPPPSSNVGLQCPFSFSSLSFPALPSYVEPFSTFSSLCSFSLIYSLMISLFQALCCDYSFNHHKCKFSCVYYDAESCEALTFKVFFYQKHKQQTNDQEQSNDTCTEKVSAFDDRSTCSVKRIWIEFQRRFGSSLTFQRLLSRFLGEFRAKEIVDDHKRSAAIGEEQYPTVSYDAQVQRLSARKELGERCRGRERSPKRLQHRSGERSFSPSASSSSSSSSSPLSSRSNSPGSPRPPSPLNAALQVEGASVLSLESSSCSARTYKNPRKGCMSSASSTASLPTISRFSSPSNSFISVPPPSPTPSVVSSVALLSPRSPSSASAGPSTGWSSLFSPPLRLDDSTIDILLCMCDPSSTYDPSTSFQALTALTCAAEECANASMLCSHKYSARLSAIIEAAMHTGDGRILRLMCLMLARLSESCAFIPSALLSHALFDSVMLVLDCSCCMFSSSHGLSTPLRRSFLLECKRLCARLLRNCMVCPWRRKQFQEKIFCKSIPLACWEKQSERKAMLEQIIQRYEKNDDPLLRKEMQTIRACLHEMKASATE